MRRLSATNQSQNKKIFLQPFLLFLHKRDKIYEELKQVLVRKQVSTVTKKSQQLKFKLQFLLNCDKAYLSKDANTKNSQVSKSYIVWNMSKIRCIVYTPGIYNLQARTLSSEQEKLLKEVYGS